MSLIDKYRATLYNLFKGDTIRILITNEYGFELITNVFSQKEMLDMEILGVFLLGDIDVFSKIKKTNYETIFFIQGENDFDLLSKSLSHCKTNIYVHFYTPINKIIADKTLVFDIEHLVQEITSSSLAFLPISDHVAISDKTNIFPILEKMPNEIKSISNTTNNSILGSNDTNYNQELLNEVSSKLEECRTNCTLYEKGREETILVVISRSFDRVTPLIIPWTYEALFRYLKLTLENNTGHCNDKFFTENRFEYYSDVVEKIKKESILITNQYKNKSDNMTKLFEIQEIEKIINRHISLLQRIKTLLDENNILLQSELEQRALIRDLSNKDKEIFKMNYNLVADEIYSSNKMSFNSRVPIYYQNVPKIRSIIESFSNCTYSNIYIYVKDYICYTEVAEIEKFNKRSNKKIYLLSDSIIDRWSYLGFVNKQISKNTFKINNYFSIKKSIVREPLINVDIKLSKMWDLDEIEEKVKKLEMIANNKNIFDDKKIKEYEKLYTDVVNDISSEYEKFKNTSDDINQLEKNYKNMKLLKLEKITCKFKKLEHKQKEDKEKIRSPLDDLFDDIEANNQNDQNFQVSKIENYDDVMTEKLINKRGEQILNIRKGVTEIQSMYIDLHRDLEMQNLMLDQVCVNLIKSSELTKKGTEELIIANDYDKKTMDWKQKIILILIILNILIWVCVGIVINFSKKHK